jgi:hypothetical protein
MASCKNCGIEISEEEKKKYMGMCLTCVLFQIDNKHRTPTRLFLVGTLFLTIGILGGIGVPLGIINEILLSSELLIIIVAMVLYSTALFLSVVFVIVGIKMVKRGVLIRRIIQIRKSK